jgi:hypothetical protein
MTGLLVQRVYTLDVDGTPTLMFKARNQLEARELCREAWLRSDLISQTSNGSPLSAATSKFSARIATAEEAKLFGEAAAGVNRWTICYWSIWLNWTGRPPASPPPRRAARFLF